MKKAVTLGILFIGGMCFGQIKVLFDATKAEMAGNADWIIDADTHNLNSNGTSTGGSNSNPQKTPTPLQSGITSSTSETYWNGGISYWAIDLVRKGFTVETLPYNGKITYGDLTNSQDLSNYKVYIIDEPNNQFSDSEKTAIINFVANGGGLFMIADHTQSDRNSDGWDSPDIWNDLFTNNTVKTNPFGITFDLKSISPNSTNFVSSTTNSTILAGPQGTPTQMAFSSGTTITLNKTNNPNVKGLIFTNGSSTTGTTNVMFATSNYGLGKVCALGDSSVPDDGTGDSGDTLYDGYVGDANGNHRPLLVNSVIWLAEDSSLSASENYNPNDDLEIYPNPTKDYIYIKNNSADKNFKIKIIDGDGRLKYLGEPLSDKIDVRGLSSGVYYVQISGDKKNNVIKFIKE